MQRRGRWQVATGVAVGTASAAGLFAVVGSLAADLPAQAAMSQHGCSFSVPKPSIRKGAASFTMSVACSSMPQRRRVVVALVADDPSYDDVLQSTSRTVRFSPAARSLSGSAWRCGEEASGKDEVYLQVRVDAYVGGSWRKSTWVRGATASGRCP